MLHLILSQPFAYRPVRIVVIACVRNCACARRASPAQRASLVVRAHRGPEGVGGPEQAPCRPLIVSHVMTSPSHGPPTTKPGRGLWITCDAHITLCPDKCISICTCATIDSGKSGFDQLQWATLFGRYTVRWRAVMLGLMLGDGWRKALLCCHHCCGFDSHMTAQGENVYPHRKPIGTCAGFMIISCGRFHYF